MGSTLFRFFSYGTRDSLGLIRKYIHSRFKVAYEPDRKGWMPWRWEYLDRLSWIGLGEVRPNLARSD